MPRGGHPAPTDGVTDPKPPPKPRVSEPTLTSVRIGYSVGLKVNLGNYESADFHLSENQAWDVTGLSPTDLVAFADTKRAEIAKRLSDEIVAKGELAREQEIT